MHSHRALTFLFVFATTILLGVADATQFNNHNHVRMIKKRAAVESAGVPTKPSVPVIGVGQDPNQRPTDGLPLKGTASVSAASSSVSAQPSGGLGPISIPVDPILSAVTGQPSQTASVANVSDSSSLPLSTASSSSVVQAPSSAPAQDSNAIPSNIPAQTPQSAAVVTVLSTANAQPTTNTTAANASAAGATSESTAIAKKTLIIIASIGGAIALVAIIWTIIRKTKFRPSDEFEDRLNPINWDPSNTSSDSGIMTERPQPGAGLYRSNSRGSNRSFHSADAQHPQQYNNNSLIPDLPNHDFTAGSGGQQRVYADLYRGPSPGPNQGPYDARGYGGY